MLADSYRARGQSILVISRRIADVDRLFSRVPCRFENFRNMIHGQIRRAGLRSWRPIKMQIHRRPINSKHVACLADVDFCCGGRASPDKAISRARQAINSIPRPAESAKNPSTEMPRHVRSGSRPRCGSYRGGRILKQRRESPRIGINYSVGCIRGISLTRAAHADTHKTTDIARARAPCRSTPNDR
jgi:hypothetical protein